MDCQMPVMDGFQASKILVDMMKNKLIPKIPIIACTAHAFDEDIEKCRSNGMSLHLAKPVSLDKLDLILKKIKVF